MERKEILATIRNLATVDGFYGRIYKALATVYKTNPAEFALIMDKLEAQHFNDATELVLYFEC